MTRIPVLQQFNHTQLQVLAAVTWTIFGISLKTLYDIIKEENYDQVLKPEWR